jgi:hypothetical protein
MKNLTVIFYILFVLITIDSCNHLHKMNTENNYLNVFVARKVKEKLISENPLIVNDGKVLGTFKEINKNKIEIRKRDIYEIFALSSDDNTTFQIYGYVARNGVVFITSMKAYNIKKENFTKKYEYAEYPNSN